MLKLCIYSMRILEERKGCFGMKIYIVVGVGIFGVFIVYYLVKVEVDVILIDCKDVG